MTINLPEDLESSVGGAEVTTGRFASADDAVAEIVRGYFHQKQSSGSQDDAVAALDAQPPPSSKRKPLWERAAALRESIPAEEWDKLPSDGARQLDHYLHGSPKRPTP